MEMTDEEPLEQYRRMTPAERFELWAGLTELGSALWEENLTEEEIQGRVAAWRREHDLSDRNMLRTFREAG